LVQFEREPSSIVGEGGKAQGRLRVGACLEFANHTSTWRGQASGSGTRVNAEMPQGEDIRKTRLGMIRLQRADD
jgi:hypothetical protein